MRYILLIPFLSMIVISFFPIKSRSNPEVKYLKALKRLHKGKP